ncbi:MAG: glycosyltransferase family 4 protein [Bryobacteraceae bacterium]|nr:glycosyltransferase family 4 protein [Bryobacteraceae bacterium]
MRVLHVDTGLQMRGGQWQAFYLSQALLAAGHESVLMTPEGSPLSTAAAKGGLPVAALRFGDLWRASRSFDIVHAHTARAHTLAALAAVRRLVVSRRVAFPVGRGFLSRWKYRRAAHFLAVSNHVRQGLTEAGIPARRVSVVYDGAPLLEPSRLTGPAVAPAIDDPRKGSALAREAALRAGIPLRFSTDLSGDLREAGMFVYITQQEGLGSAALLAMSASVPVVASRVGGLPEAIEHEATGLLADNAPEAIARCMRILTGDRELAAAMGRLGRAAVEQRFTVGRMAAGTLDAYQRLVS